MEMLLLNKAGIYMTILPLPVSFLCPAEAGKRGRESDEAHVWEEQAAVEEEWWPPANFTKNGGETEEPEPRKCRDGEKLLTPCFFLRLKIILLKKGTQMEHKGLEHFHDVEAEEAVGCRATWRDGCGPWSLERTEILKLSIYVIFWSLIDQGLHLSLLFVCVFPSCRRKNPPVLGLLHSSPPVSPI